MFRQVQICPAACHGIAALAAIALLMPSAAAQSPRLAAPGLKSIFDAAWTRQPEARSLAAREEAADARREATGSWTVEPPALELSAKSDRLNRNQGNREQVLGIAVPLWLPDEQARAGALADAEARVVATRLAAARLRTAAAVREAYWTWERARVNVLLARDRVASAQSLAIDVVRRVKAGDLARADLHQADGNVAAAESALADSLGALATSIQQVTALTGEVLQGDAGIDAAITEPIAEPHPAVASSLADPGEAHPEIADSLALGEAARHAMELARVRTRANPELVLSTARERANASDPSLQTITLGVRIPFGSDSRHRALVASANADALESESRARLARDRVVADLRAARQRVESAKLVVDAATRRTWLARETREFFDKSFRAGNTDLPSRLRVEQEAVEAERLAARARIDFAASVSGLRQALGLLPE